MRKLLPPHVTFALGIIFRAEKFTSSAQEKRHKEPFRCFKLRVTQTEKERERERERERRVPRQLLWQELKL